jgi:phospho-N-acetylmuramoyl-pentapeptide-transferase
MVLDLGYFYPLMVIVIITGASNAVNLTDGLDGLASGLLAISFTVFSAISYISGRIDFSDYLNIIYIPEAGELTIFTAAMAGSCIGYLWYNTNPAEIFMGDTGSLSTGAALGALAILLKKELLLVIIGGVFVFEAISVIVQVIYFKWTKLKTGQGKRFFKMAPIHHHFELSGWPESKVVVRFWIIGLLLALLSLSTFKVR